MNHETLISIEDLIKKIQDINNLLKDITVEEMTKCKETYADAIASLEQLNNSLKE